MYRPLPAKCRSVLDGLDGGCRVLRSAPLKVDSPPFWYWTGGEHLNLRITRTLFRVYIISVSPHDLFFLRVPVPYEYHRYAAIRQLAVQALKA